MTTLVVPHRYRGPARSGNGGWSAGALAEHVDAPVVTVRLRRPPPLDAPLGVRHEDGWLLACQDDAAVLQARPAAGPLTPVDMVDVDEARAAEASYAGLLSHPFPTCFTCGTGREPGDGLRIFPGRVDEHRVAATWTPHESVATDGRATVPVTWAALDCAGAWAAGVEERPLVLGSVTAQVLDLPAVGEEHVVLGEVRGTEGRKTFTATSVRDRDGRLLGTTECVWIAVDPADFN